MHLKAFELPFEDFVLRGDTYDEGCETIILHGAGQSSRSRFSRMRTSLNAHGIPSASFDFIGHGETGGELLGTSLHARTKQAAMVIRHTCVEPLTLIAASMGAYTAIKLTERFSVNNLVLMVPAVYTSKAYDVKFGPEFSAIIRAPNSWQDSDAFSILKGFTGNLLIIAAENDHVIPIEVIERIHAAASHARTNHLHIVPESTHLSLFPNLEDFHLALDRILALCRGVLDKRRN